MENLFLDIIDSDKSYLKVVGSLPTILVDEFQKELELKQADKGVRTLSDSLKDKTLVLLNGGEKKYEDLLSGFKIWREEQLILSKTEAQRLSKFLLEDSVSLILAWEIIVLLLEYTSQKNRIAITVKNSQRFLTDVFGD